MEKMTSSLLEMHCQICKNSWRSQYVLVLNDSKTKTGPKKSKEAPKNV
jgi:hypothetical protein